MKPPRVVDWLGAAERDAVWEDRWGFRWKYVNERWRADDRIGRRPVFLDGPFREVVE